MSIKTTGDLRALIAKAIEDVRDGRISIEKAASIQKLAGRMNESLYSEAKLLALVSPGSKLSELGKMDLHNA